MQKESLNQYMIVSYTLKNISQKKKVKFLRKLQGYKEKKEKKEYSHEGLIQKLNAKKLGSNVILSPIENFSEIHNLLSSYNIKAEVKEAWMK
ncbi:hypothetical protein ISS07_02105 [Candidatus Woesearchaeota archaeon]|nr:hypothetical protein [Candidatus Woesearchaeota archaeon]